MRGRPVHPGRRRGRLRALALPAAGLLLSAAAVSGGADAWDDRTPYYRTPLHTAAAYGSAEELLWLLSLRAGDAPASKREGNDAGAIFERGSALLAAYHAGEAGLTELAAAFRELQPLLGYDLGVRDNGGEVPLHAAGRNDDPAVTAILLALGSKLRATAGVEARDLDRETPLHVAAAYGSAPMVALLLLDGSDPNAADGDSWTPLHEASSTGTLEVARLLLEHGADPDAKTRKFETIFDFARPNPNIDVRELRAAVRDFKERT